MSDLIDRQAAIEKFAMTAPQMSVIRIYEAVEILESMPTIQPEKAQLFKQGATSDLISRQQALDIFDDYNVSVENGELEAYSRDRKRLCDLPPIQPEPQEGTWVYGEDSTADCVDGYRCSRCGFFVPWDYNHKLIDYINDYAYCPNCGARMKGERQK